MTLQYVFVSVFSLSLISFFLSFFKGGEGRDLRRQCQAPLLQRTSGVMGKGKLVEVDGPQLSWTSERAAVEGRQRGNS